MTQRSGLTDAQYAEAKRRIDRTMRTWIHRLGLGWWTIQTVYETDRSSFRESYPDQFGLQGEAKMSVRCDWQYAQATITVNMEAVAEMDDSQLEHDIVHELCHCLVCEMRVPDWADAPDAVYQSLRDHEERVVTNLTKAFGWTYLAGAGELDEPEVADDSATDAATD